LAWQVEFSAGLRLPDGRVGMRVAISGCSGSVFAVSASFLEKGENWEHVSPLFRDAKRGAFLVTLLFSLEWGEMGGGVGHKR
jgi:hypothetical protein